MKLSLRTSIAAASLVVVLAVAVPAALASGGAGGGGANAGGGSTATAPATSTSTTTTQTRTGGGAAKGGVKDVVVITPPPPPPAAPGAPCVQIVSVSAPVGYYLTYAALWNTYAIRSCSTGAAQTYNVRVQNIDVATGTVVYDVTIPYLLAGGQNINGVLDNDFAPFSTTLAIDITVSDSSGNILAEAVGQTTTPPAR